MNTDQKPRWNHDGTFNGHSQFTLPDLLKIHERYRKGESARTISRDLDVGIETIRRILRGDNFPDVLRMFKAGETGMKEDELGKAARESEERMKALMEAGKLIGE